MEDRFITANLSQNNYFRNLAVKADNKFSVLLSLSSNVQ